MRREQGEMVVDVARDVVAIPDASEAGEVVDRIPEGVEWRFEPDWDGLRVAARLGPGLVEARLRTGSGVRPVLPGDGPGAGGARGGIRRRARFIGRGRRRWLGLRRGASPAASDAGARRRLRSDLARHARDHGPDHPGEPTCGRCGCPIAAASSKASPPTSDPPGPTTCGASRPARHSSCPRRRSTGPPGRPGSKTVTPPGATG